MSIVKQITITVRGDEEVDFDNGLDEAVRLVREGYLSGQNSNESGGFYFVTNLDLPVGEWPR